MSKCIANATVKTVDLVDIKGDPTWITGGEYWVEATFEIHCDIYCDKKPGVDCVACTTTVGTAFNHNVTIKLSPSSPKIQGCIPELFVPHGVGRFILCLTKHGMSVDDFIISSRVDYWINAIEQVIATDYYGDQLCSCYVGDSSNAPGNVEGVIGPKEEHLLKKGIDAKIDELNKKNF